MNVRSDLDKQAVKCVNEFIQRADGNFKRAENLWHEEIKSMPYGWRYKRYVHAVCEAFRAMRPAPARANGSP